MVLRSRYHCQSGIPPSVPYSECFINWMRPHSSDDKDVIAIDENVWHSYDKSRRKGAIYVIQTASLFEMSLDELLLPRLNGKS